MDASGLDGRALIAKGLIAMAMGSGERQMGRSWLVGGVDASLAPDSARRRSRPRIGNREWRRCRRSRATSEKLGAPSPHWFFVYDANFLGYLDSKVYLFDGDTGSMLGMLSTGAFGNAVEFAPDFSAIYVPEMYYSRGTSRRAHRHRRDLRHEGTEGSVGEVVIPPKRATGMPQRAYQGISDDGRFMYVANMTPATSVSVVDVKAREFVAEIEMCRLQPGLSEWAIASFASLCGDGTLQVVSARRAGQPRRARRTARSSSIPNKDPSPRKRRASATRGSSFRSTATCIRWRSTAARSKSGKPWSLFTDKERADGWKIGGGQFNAVHQKLGRLLRDRSSRADRTVTRMPGKDVWVIRPRDAKRLGSISMVAPVTNRRGDEGRRAAADRRRRGDAGGRRL